MEIPATKTGQALPPRYRKLLAARSDFRIFGDQAIFVDQSGADLVEITAEAAAAKVFADLVLVTSQPQLVRIQKPALFAQQIIDPFRKLILPLISGQSPWLTGETTPEHMFAAMLDWVRHTGSDTAATRKTESDGADAMELAVFLTLDVLLDGADIREATGRSVKLNMPQLFRCLCHLLLCAPRPAAAVPSGQENTAAVRQKLFAEALRRLQRDGIARKAPDDDTAFQLH
jgi:hypothetical protein